MIDLGARLSSFLPYSFSAKSSALVWLQRSVIFSAEVVQTTTLRRKKEGGRRKFRGNECWELLLYWTPHSFFFPTAIQLTLCRETFEERGRIETAGKILGTVQGRKHKGNRRVRTLKPPGCVWSSGNNVGILCWPDLIGLNVVSLLPNEGRLGHTLMWPHTKSTQILTFTRDFLSLFCNTVTLLNSSCF